MRGHYPRRLLSWLLFLAPGCTSDPVAAPTNRLTPADFASAVAHRAAPGQDALEVNAVGHAVSQKALAAPSEESLSPLASPSSDSAREASRETSPPAPGQSVLIDAKVGEVSGRAIYASTFFDVGTPTQEPLGPRLAAEARRLDRNAWLAYARDEISKRLGLYIEEELLRAEALSTLTPEQKQGLFAFVQSMQADLQRQAGGSREALKRQLEEREGITADQWLRRQEREVLQRYELERRIFRGINIAWRDIEQAYYGRFRDLYQRPPVYRFYVMRLPAASTREQNEFEQALRSGTSFVELAGGPTNRHTSPGGLEERQWRPEQTNQTLFADPSLDAAAKSLSIGQVAGPIVVGDYLWWIHLAAIESPRSLYEAQFEIEQKLISDRRREALDRYLARLRDRASVTSIAEMGNRLLRIAVERYYPR